MRFIVAIATLVACSGAWAGQAPEGWKKLDFICESLERKGYEMDDYFWVSERDEDVWIETHAGGQKTHHRTTPIYLSKSYFGPDGDLVTYSEIDRSTGRQTHRSLILDYSVTLDCELRRANKF